MHDITNSKLVIEYLNFGIKCVNSDQLAQCDIKAKYMLTIYEVYLISLFQIPIRPGIR